MGLTSPYRPHYSDHPPRCTEKMGGGNPPIFPFFLHFLSLFVHYFLENVTREPPITPKGGIRDPTRQRALAVSSSRLVRTWQGVPFWVFSQLLGCYLKPIVWYFTTQLALNNIRVIGKTPKKAHLGARRATGAEKCPKKIL